MKKIAYFDSTHDLPEEIIMAAGFESYKIMGDVSVPNDPADAYLANFFCPVARSCMVEALAGSGNWAGIVFGHGCDATNRHFDVWKRHVDTPYLYWFNTPLNTNHTAAVFFKKEISLFMQSLEKYFTVRITEEGLRSAIDLSNEIKLKLQKLGALRANKDIPNVDYFDAVKKSLQLPKRESLAHLDACLEDWSKRSGFPNNKTPILLTGSDVTYPEFMEILDRAGLRVVRDDLSIGERYYATLIPVDKDPVEALVSYHFNIPRPATKNPPDKRLSYLLDCMDRGTIAGIVSQNMKFCEPFALDSVLINQALKDRGYKLIHLERDFTHNIDMTLVNRLQAFGELL
jgi:benzoyl-CoA reductase/2-hydroxyglutaryl-CoA dehydratase subunit BcrC/BadD/HgdB